MRTFWRTASPGLLRDVGLVCLADGIVGVSFGATSLGGGLPWWVPVALSLLVFAGGSQIAAVGVVLAGGSPLAAVLAGAVLNTRLFPYGFAVADVLGPAAGSGAVRRWLARLAGTHVITDE
jgi:branched chain amino acid efflux pump